MRTTDFEEWLEDNRPSGDVEVFEIYRAVCQREDFCGYKVTTRGDMTFVSGPISTLQLFSEKARTAFLVTIAKSVGECIATMEGWYLSQRAMAKAD